MLSYKCRGNSAPFWFRKDIIKKISFQGQNEHYVISSNFCFITGIKLLGDFVYKIKIIQKLIDWDIVWSV